MNYIPIIVVFESVSSIVYTLEIWIIDDREAVVYLFLFQYIHYSRTDTCDTGILMKFKSVRKVKCISYIDFHTEIF